jgi:hypothetical protein
MLRKSILLLFISYFLKQTPNKNSRYTHRFGNQGSEAAEKMRKGKCNVLNHMSCR